MIYYDDPACSCGPLCAQPTSQPEQPTPGSGAAGGNAIIQDTTLPTSFFRRSGEIRDKIYFLSCRPDCRYSLGGKEGCDKTHIHNSAKGRASAWKWLVLCRQTWSEASCYMPTVRNDIRFYINDDNCARCWHDRNRCLQEGMLHASLNESLIGPDELHEIWYIRLRKLTIQFENPKDIHGEIGHQLNRIDHNLESVVAFIRKLRNLKEITIEIKPDFTSLLPTNTDISSSITRLFSALKACLDNGLLKINISQWAYEINDSTSDTVLKLAALADLSDNAFNLTTTKTARFNFDTFLSSSSDDAFQFDAGLDSEPTFNTLLGSGIVSDSGHEEEKQREASVGSQLLYRTKLFDEDFEGLPEPDKPVWEEIEIPSDTPGEPVKKERRCIMPYWNKGVPNYTLCRGCIITNYEKYSQLRDFLPLYIEEDFYHTSESATEQYQSIPECFLCGIVFSSFEQVAVHADQCAGRDNTMTRVPSPWND